MLLLWGDIHNHCDISYGYGSLENALNAAKKQLDFCSVTPHAMWPDIPEVTPESEYLVGFHNRGFEKIKNNWEQVKRVMEAANRDGKFVTFHSFEMHSSKYGDHHIVSPDVSLELIYADTPHDAVRRQRCPAIAIPHHIAYGAGYRGIAWRYFDERLSPIVEVYSKHGCGLKDDGAFPYLHTMGPRDGRNTAYAGLRAGKRFGFAASTDHHAGFPGSYGDGKLAVSAENKTRKAIWAALSEGRTYAVTGDKIRCTFTLNDMPYGSRISSTRKRLIRYSVEGGGALDDVVLYRNLEPIMIVNNLSRTLSPGTDGNCFKVRLELGWGDEDGPYLWHCAVRAENGRFVSVEPCIRGRSVLAPSPSLKDDPDINKLAADLRFTEDTRVEFDCETWKNPSPTHSQTSAVNMEIEGGEDTRLNFVINQHKLSLTIGELLGGSVTGQERSYASTAFRIHSAVPREKYYCEGTYAEHLASEGDFYHMEARQTNGCAAYVTPVYMI